MEHRDGMGQSTFSSNFNQANVKQFSQIEDELQKVNKKYLNIKRQSAYDSKSQVPKINIDSTRNNKAKKPLSYLTSKTDRIRAKNHTIVHKNVSPMKLPNLDTNFLKH